MNDDVTLFQNSALSLSAPSYKMTPSTPPQKKRSMAASSSGYHERALPEPSPQARILLSPVKKRLNLGNNSDKGIITI